MADSDAATQIAPEGGARIPLLSAEEMSPEQRSLHDEVVSGPRGQMIGPLRAAIHSPELAVRWSRLGEFLRFDTCLPKGLNELAIVVTARRWSAQVEWWVHARVAIENGIDPDVIAAIQGLAAPVFAAHDQYEVYEFVRQLQQTGQVSEEAYGAVLARWGVRGTVELTAVVGYYTMVAMTLNAHCLPVPDGSEPLSVDGELCVLPPARRSQDQPA